MTSQSKNTRRKPAKPAGRRTVLFVSLALLAAAILALAAIFGGPREYRPEGGPKVVAGAVELAVPGEEPAALPSAEPSETTESVRTGSEALPAETPSPGEAAVPAESTPDSAPQLAESVPVAPAGPSEEAIDEGEARALAALAPAAGPVVKPAQLVDDGPGLPWRAYAAAAPAVDGRPMIALVIDDLGHNNGDVERAIALDPAVTLAFLPYTNDVERSVWLARRARHEVLVHLPMEPENGDADPGPEALLTGMDRDDLLQTLYWNFARFDQYAGVNNHMGSKFSESREDMELVLGEVKRRGLLYLDSVTTPNSTAPALAAELGIPFAGRDVFLDNELDAGSISAELARLEAIARRKGYAVAIAHPHPETFREIEAWLPTLSAKGFVLVPVSAIVLKNAKAARAVAEAAKG